MMRRNRLYTVNQYNKPAFFFGSNKFNFGGTAASWDKAASGAFGANYGDAGFTMNDYMNSKNWLGLSKADNPFSKGNLMGAFNKDTLGNLVSTGAGIIGGLANTAISGGLESKAGSAIGSIGNTVGNVVSAVNPIVGGAISLGSSLVGGLVTRAFGTAVDQAKLNAATDGTTAYNNFKSSAGSFDDITVPESQANVQDAYSGGWFSSNKARKKNEALRQAREESRQLAFKAINNNVSNLANDQLNGALANFSALGGPLSLGGGALGLMQQNRYFETLDNRSAALAGKRPILGLPPQTLAFGGELGTNGTDWSNGLLHIDEGGSHESNPLEGVPMGFDAEGVPNLVEEGETIWNDYVFSNRLQVPKNLLAELGLPPVASKKRNNSISFADASKKLGKESEQRPNDPISKAGLEASMSRLAEMQETEKMKRQMEEYVGLAGYACGGKLGRKYSTGSKLKKGITGLNTYGFDPIEQFKYWNKDSGNYDTGYRDFIENKLNEDWIKRVMAGHYGDMSRYKRANQVNPTLQQAGQLGLDQKNSDWHKAMAAAYDEYKAGIDPKTGTMVLQAAPMGEVPIPDPGAAEEVLELPIELMEVQVAPESGKEKMATKDPKTYWTGLRYAPVLGAGIMALTDTLGLTNKPDYTMADALQASASQAGTVPNVRFDPIGNYITYRPMDIWYEQNRLNANARSTDRGIVNTSGGNRGTAVAGLLANGYSNQIASGNLYRQALEYNDAKRERVADFNRRTNMFNSQMGLEAAMANARYNQQAKQMKLSGLAQAAALRDSIDQRVGAARAANLTNFLNNLGDIGRENFIFNQINWDRSRRYKANKNGTSYYDGHEEFGLGGRIKKHY